MTRCRAAKGIRRPCTCSESSATPSYARTSYAPTPNTHKIYKKNREKIRHVHGNSHLQTFPHQVLLYSSLCDSQHLCRHLTFSARFTIVTLFCAAVASNSIVGFLVAALLTLIAVLYACCRCCGCCCFRSRRPATASASAVTNAAASATNTDQSATASASASASAPGTAAVAAKKTN
jgi:hypothetical protein